MQADEPSEGVSIGRVIAGADGRVVERRIFVEQILDVEREFDAVQRASAAGLVSDLQIDRRRRIDAAVIGIAVGVDEIEQGAGTDIATCPVGAEPPAQMDRLAGQVDVVESRRGGG